MIADNVVVPLSTRVHIHSMHIQQHAMVILDSWETIKLFIKHMANQAENPVESTIQLNAKHYCIGIQLHSHHLLDDMVILEGVCFVCQPVISKYPKLD